MSLSNGGDFSAVAGVGADSLNIQTFHAIAQGTDGVSVDITNQLSGVDPVMAGPAATFSGLDM